LKRVAKFRETEPPTFFPIRRSELSVPLFLTFERETRFVLINVIRVTNGRAN